MVSNINNVGWFLYSSIMFLTVLGSSNGLLEFPAVLGGIPDDFSTMLMLCVLKISASFYYQWVLLCFLWLYFSQVKKSLLEIFVSLLEKVWLYSKMTYYLSNFVESSTQNKLC